MRISEKEWEIIDFRRKKYKQLRDALDMAVTGRDNKVSAFVFGEGGRFSTSAVDKLVESLVNAMDKYGSLNLVWLIGPDDDPEDWPHMPEKFREFMSDYLYCIIRLMMSNMDWIEEFMAWPFEDSFQQILDYSLVVKEWAVVPEGKRFEDLWYEVYYGAREGDGLFNKFTLAFEALKGVDIGTTMSPQLKDRLYELCNSQNETADECAQEVEYDEEDYAEAMRRFRAEEEEDDPETAEFNQCMDERYSGNVKDKGEFIRNFVDPDIYCERYVRMREIFYMDLDKTDVMERAFTRFDELVEGMLDMYLCQRDMSLYSDVDEFVKSYTYIKKQLDRIKTLREGV